MLHSISFMLDEFTPIAIYKKVKKFFPNEISFLFESVVYTSEGNFSYIVAGEKKRIWVCTKCLKAGKVQKAIS